MTAEPIVELRDVAVPSRRDSELAIIEGVNWSVNAGEFWVIGGHQESGKSDLMFMLAGLTKPLRGVYQMLGQDIARRFGDEFLSNRLRVGMVFDDARLLNHLTIAENVSLPARYHQNFSFDEAQSWTTALLKETEIAEFANNTPSTVRRNWCRRAALARALAIKPDVFLLENPLRGLDSRHATWWLQFITKLWRGHALLSGKPATVIASTDEFYPWRNSGAQFATLHRKAFATAGSELPRDDAFMSRTAGEEI